jgi:virulence factor Mce-like protein
VLGLVFLAVLAGLLSLSIAAYQQVFTKVTLVTLDTDHTGAQLLPQSDVKLRGILVGQVRSITTYTRPGSSNQAPETRARVTMALEPGKTDLIPYGTTAVLLPKTLFGERYVALQVPTELRGDAARPVRAGDTLYGGKDAIEIERVLDDLYPVLVALQPQQLKTTLTALATALQGRGKQLGDNLASFGDYLSKLNPKVPTLVDDLDKLGKVATLYDQAAPDLLSSLDNLSTTAQTLTSRTQALDDLLKSATAASNVFDQFLNANGNYLISVAASSSKILALLARYAPEYPCVLEGLAALEPRIEDSFGGKQPGLHITLEVVKNQGKYVPGNEPVNPGSVSPGVPHCFGLPNPPEPFPGYVYPDGASPNGAPTGTPANLGSADRSAYNASGAGNDNASGVGSPAESKLVATLISGSFGDDPSKVPAIATVLAAPILRGSQVTVAGTS